LNKRTVIVVVLAGVLLAGFFVKMMKRGPGGGDASLTARVVRGNLTVTVQGSGEIKASKSNKVTPQIKSNANIMFLVPQGTAVTQNTVVARFNTEEMERKVRDIESVMMQNTQKVSEARTALDIQVMDNTVLLSKATQDVAAAEMELEKFIQGDGPIEIRKAESDARNNEGEYARKKKRYEDQQAMLKEGFVTEDQVQEASNAMEVAKVTLLNSKEGLVLLNKYTQPQKKVTLDATLVKAKADLEKAEKNSQVLLASKVEAVRLAELTMARSKEDLEKARKELESYEVKSPCEGVVSYGDPDRWWSGDRIEVGAQLYPGQVLMTIPSTGTMLARTKIHESDILLVKPGQKATIVVDALAGRSFAGTVSNVAEVAITGWMSPDVKEFNVDVAILDGSELKQGFSCDVEIITDVVTNTLYLPLQAVFREGERYVVYPVDKPNGASVEVKIGKTSRQSVQVIEGIKEGEKVYMTKPAAGGKS
jgi:HlyD family secretion protein